MKSFETFLWLKVYLKNFDLTWFIWLPERKIQIYTSKLWLKQNFESLCINLVDGIRRNRNSFRGGPREGKSFTPVGRWMDISDWDRQQRRLEHFDLIRHDGWAMCFDASTLKGAEKKQISRWLFTLCTSRGWLGSENSSATDVATEAAGSWENRCRWRGALQSPRVLLVRSNHIKTSERKNHNQLFRPEIHKMETRGRPGGWLVRVSA